MNYEVKPSYLYSISKTPGQSSKSSVRPLLSEAKPSYVYSILKPHGQTSQSPIRLLLREAEPSYTYTTLKKYHLPRVGPKQLCAIAHLGCTRAAGTSQYITMNSYHTHAMINLSSQVIGSPICFACIHQQMFNC